MQWHPLYLVTVLYLYIRYPFVWLPNHQTNEEIFIDAPHFEIILYH